MNVYEVKPLPFGKEIKCKVPGSKSITNRAFLLAALAEGKSCLNGIQLSSDARSFLDCLKTLGYEYELDESKQSILISGRGKTIPNKQGVIDVGSAGTAARFLTAMLAFSDGTYQIQSSRQMAKRPMEDLLVALEDLGARFHFKDVPYHLPYLVTGMKQKEENVKIQLNIDKSSQFLSALLMASVLGGQNLMVVLKGNRKAKSYVNITVKMMEEFGCPVYHGNEEIELKESDLDAKEDIYVVRKGSRYQAREYSIEPDVSAACYFYAMAALTEGTAMVKGVDKDSIQGDIKFLRVLEQMGCRLWEGEEGLCLRGPGKGRIQGIDVDLSDCSDQSMTLAAMAPFADAPVTIRGIGHIRGQESDRIRAMGRELARMGIRCEEGESWIRIYPGNPKPAAIQTYEDHRMAMAFAVTGLRTPGLKITNPECCSKTFPDYFRVLDEITS